MSQSQLPPIVYAEPSVEPTRTSAAAVASLICGILGCFVVTGIVAIVTGIIGLRATRNPQVRGRGLAIAGLSLGIFTTLAGGGCLVAGGVGLLVGYQESSKAVVTIDALTKAAAANDMNAASKLVDPALISQADLQNFFNIVQPLGAPGAYTRAGFNTKANYGTKTTVDVSGSVAYPGGDKPLNFTLQKQSDGTYLVVGIRW